MGEHCVGNGAVVKKCPEKIVKGFREKFVFIHRVVAQFGEDVPIGSQFEPYRYVGHHFSNFVDGGLCHQFKGGEF